jgi:hypothetical protein
MRRAIDKELNRNKNWKKYKLELETKITKPELLNMIYDLDADKEERVLYSSDNELMHMNMHNMHMQHHLDEQLHEIQAMQYIHILPARRLQLQFQSEQNESCLKRKSCPLPMFPRQTLLKLARKAGIDRHLNGRHFEVGWKPDRRSKFWYYWKCNANAWQKMSDADAENENNENQNQNNTQRAHNPNSDEYVYEEKEDEDQDQSGEEESSVQNTASNRKSRRRPRRRRQRRRKRAATQLHSESD